MVACPEITMTSGALSSSRMLSSVCSPSMPGSQMSSKRTSKLFLPSNSRQASPLAASETLYPSSSSTPRRDSRMADSSSTIRALGIGGGRGGRHPVSGDRQLDNEPRSHRLVFFDANVSVVILDDSAYDRQGQTGSTRLGREIGQEQTLLGLAGNAGPAVGDADFDRIATGDQRR